MRVASLQKLSLIDYPDKIATIVFLEGCNFRCPFCQNPDLVLSKENSLIQEKVFFSFLERRKGLIDGVCITGGEPTIQPGLIEFIGRIKKQGFLVKLDTNGNEPKVLENLLKKRFLDFVAMDIKSSPERYSEAVGKKINLEELFKSIDLIQKSKIDYEFRTTAVPGLVNREEIQRIGEWLKGSKAFSLQQFRAEKTLDEEWQKIRPYTDLELKELIEIAKPYFQKVELRGL